MVVLPKADTWFCKLAILCLISIFSRNVIADIEAGPFQTSEEAAQYSEEQELPSEITSRLAQVPADYIIVSEFLGSERSLDLLDELLRKRIDDVVVVRTGDFGGRVSAGVYLSLGPSAQRRLRRLRDEGFTFESLPRKMQDITQYWVITREAVSAEARTSEEAQIAVPEPGPAPAPTNDPLVESVVESEVQSEVQTTMQPTDEVSTATIAESEVLVTPIKKSPQSTPESRVRRMPEETTPWLLYGGILMIIVVVTGLLIFLMSRKRRLAQQAGMINRQVTPATAQISKTVDTGTVQSAALTPAAASPSATTPETGEIANNELSTEELSTEEDGIRGKQALDAISDQIVLAGNLKAADNPGIFSLDEWLLATVNHIRGIHHLGPIKYRPTSILPSVYGDAPALHHMLGIVIEQAVSFDDAAHVLVQASHANDQLVISCQNESALLGETELQVLADTKRESGLRLATAMELASRMAGAITFESKFGIGTIIKLAIKLPTAEQPVILNKDEISTLSESRMRLIKSREVAVPATQAGLESLESMLSPTNPPELGQNNNPSKLEATVDALKQQLSAVQSAEQQTVKILEGVLTLTNRNRQQAAENEHRINTQVLQVVTELNQAKPTDQSEPKPRAFPPYGSTDSSAEFFDQLKSQLVEIETSRALGDMQTLSRVARWTAKYADGLGMTLVASQFRTMGEAMRRGDELRMLEALTLIHMGLVQISDIEVTSSKLG